VVHSVTETKMLGEPAVVGYVRLGSFQKLTVGELEAAVHQLLQSGMQSLIIDLRGNPGGLLDVALQVANHFINNGVLVSTRGRAWGQSFEHSARRGAAVWGFPLAVLIDGDSASASEIFAGAIKDHGRGLVVGTTSYGKGSVQSIFPLRSANTGLRLTTAYFYSPTGKVYQNTGVEPDLYVSRSLDALGQEVPVGRHPTPEDDPQLRAAYDALIRASRIEHQAAR
jgi:carboxyl-terminal processing protease